MIQTSIVSNTLTGSPTTSASSADDDYDYTTRSGSVTLKHGDRVRAAADYGLVKSDPGSIYVYNGADGTVVDLGMVDFKAAPLAWKKVVLTTQQQLDNFYPNIGNLSDSDARAIGILIVLNDVRAEVLAWIDNADVTAGEPRASSAAEEAQIAAEATSTVDGVRRLVQRRRHGAGDQRPDRDERRPLEGARVDHRQHDPRRRAASRVEARDSSAIDATVHRGDLVRRPRGQHRARVQLDRLGRRRTSSSTSSTRSSATR